MKKNTFDAIGKVNSHLNNNVNANHKEYVGCHDGDDIFVVKRIHDDSWTEKTVNFNFWSRIFKVNNISSRFNYCKKLWE